MKIIGIGVDVVDIERFAQTLARTPRLRERLFTATEQTLPIASLAARFAAKEALAKALVTDGGLAWLDAGVIRLPRGQPVFWTYFAKLLMPLRSSPAVQAVGASVS